MRSALLCLLLAALALLQARPAPAQSLRGSRSSVNRMYDHAVSNGIYFYRTGDGIRNAAKKGRFMRLAGNADYRVAGASYPYVRPATRTFVERLAAQHRRECGERLVITSAARPRSMRLINSVTRSVHPTGMAVDLRKPRSSRCRAWLRRTLLQLEGAGLIEATEEYTPPHFHVAVFPEPYRRYVQRRGGEVYAAASESSRYRVRSGDSLWKIAREHNTSVERLKLANGLRSSTIRIGQTLVIPE